MHSETVKIPSNCNHQDNEFRIQAVQLTSLLVSDSVLVNQNNYKYGDGNAAVYSKEVFELFEFEKFSALKIFNLSRFLSSSHF